MRSPIRFLITALALVSGIGAANAADTKPLKVFFLTQSGTFEHSVVQRKSADKLSLAEESIIAIGKESGAFTVQCSKDSTLITPELLKDLDVMMFYTTGAIECGAEEAPHKAPADEWVKKDEKLQISEANWKAFDAWLKSGKAMVGIHSATDTGGNFKPYWSMINGTFIGHPWTNNMMVSFTNHEPAHPAVAMWPAEFAFKEEIYHYKNYDPAMVRILLSINMEKTDLKDAHMVPVSWVRDVEKGRLFYTNLGHNESTWANPLYKQHLLAGLKWAAKQVDGPAKPNPELQAELEQKARHDTFSSGVAVLGEISGKDRATLKIAWDKAVAADAKNAEKLYRLIDGARRIDAKKEADKRTAEIAKAVDALMAAVK
jgi:type 1 glutamine amidotransferase